MSKNLYHKEQYLKRMITLFSLLGILISVVGIFGLVVFETQYRRKEIGIRKVLGALVGFRPRLASCADNHTGGRNFPKLALGQ